jgi:hypothetical protein
MIPEPDPEEDPMESQSSGAGGSPDRDDDRQGQDVTHDPGGNPERLGPAPAAGDSTSEPTDEEAARDRGDE